MENDLPLNGPRRFYVRAVAANDISNGERGGGGFYT